MADLKISQLNSIVTVVPSTDVLPVVQGGTTYKVTPNQLLGAGGTATLASATITGDLTVNTNVLKVDSTNDRVGIGTATPAVICDVTAIEADIAIFRSTGGGGNDKRLTITSGGDRIILNVSNNTNTATAQAYAFQSAGTEVGRINTTGVYVLAGGTTTANGVGVAFPSTQSASSDANCLDDYEEGTFTPTVEGTTTAGSVTYVVRLGLYTKVGRVVQFQLYVAWNTGTGTGSLRVSGLPFTANGTYLAVATVYPIDIALVAGYYAAATVQPGTSIVNIYQLPTGGGSDGSVVYDPAGQLIITGTYSV